MVNSGLSSTAPATTRAACFELAPGAGWRFRRWASQRVVAGMTDRSCEVAAILSRLSGGVSTIEAEQVHGGSLAVVERLRAGSQPIAGCDALLTNVPGVALLVRSADCLPMFFADTVQQIIGIAHVGWRGLAARLPQRVVAAFRHVYQSRANALAVAIGPAIRHCCYEVGPEFAELFGSFVHERSGRRTCDLAGVAIDQLRRCGIAADRILDAQRCTACDPQRWYSVRREGESAGRLTSLIMLRA